MGVGMVRLVGLYWLLGLFFFGYSSDFLGKGLSDITNQEITNRQSRIGLDPGHLDGAGFP